MEDTMTMSTGDAGERWAALASESPEARVEPMCAVLREVIALPADQQAAPLEAMVRAEYALDDAALHSFTSSRLRALIKMAGENMEGLRVLSHSWDRVFDRMPASVAMRRATIVQTVARSEMSPQEVSVLFELIPSIVQQIPRTPTGMTTPAERAAAAAAPPPRKPWWKFWG
jgi:hypothetical protein